MTVTPLIRHYLSIKEQYPDSLVLYQVGDFYELFFEDAQKAAQTLGIALTARGTAFDKPIPLCGVPVHTLDHHLAKLIAAKFRVVIVEQLTLPQPGKLVERGVTRVLTPGTLVDTPFLKSTHASYCAALSLSEQSYALLLIELLTGEVRIVLDERTDDRLIEAEVARYAPDEILIAKSARESLCDRLERQGHVVTRTQRIPSSTQAEWLAQWPEALRILVERSAVLQEAVELLVTYLAHHQPTALAVCTGVQLAAPESTLIMDRATQKNLDLAACADLLDGTKTAMGARLLRKWLASPVRNHVILKQRHDAVEKALKQSLLREELQKVLGEIGDLERVVGRIALKRAVPDDYRTLAHALQQHTVVQNTAAALFGIHSECDGVLDVLRAELTHSINHERGAERLIAPHYDAELDRLRALVDSGVAEIVALEDAEQRRTTIPSLKIRYHQTYGYAIEVPKSQAILVPDRYHKLQELANRWRFTTDELRSLEYAMNTAHDAAHEREKMVFEQIADRVYRARTSLRRYAETCAQYDTLQSLAQNAHQFGYVRPVFHESADIIISEGRHPLVAAQLRNSFVPNDTCLIDDASLLIITGPNMGGKSTYLKQVALIAIFAQIGSFVPARSAQLPLIDRIFTRIGASDNIAEGKSTFFVEMEETALICRYATQQSLVILDEVGRGTSSYDGLAIAQAVVEYIHDHVRARCLFATHYHELAERVVSGRGIACYHAASRELGNEIVFLHTIVPGIARGSYGIDVARKAQLPPVLIDRAQKLLFEERAQDSISASAEQVQKTRPSHELRPIVEVMRTVSLDDITPREAHDILRRMAVLIQDIH
jgi:DNA mismatch repair protein MutS